MNLQDDKTRITPNEGADNWENPDIDALIDLKKLHLLSRGDVINTLRETRDALARRLTVLQSSRSNISDFINQVTEGTSVEQRLEEVMANIEELQAKMYEEESAEAEMRYKDKFDELLHEILVKKAEIQRLALSRFINESPPYLDRVMKRAREEGEKDTVALVEEARKLRGGKDKDEVKSTLVWLSGEENDMSPVDYKIWSEELSAKAKTELESWLTGDTDDQNLEVKFSELLEEARRRGGEKAVLKLRALRNDYRVTRENYELAELTYVHNIFGQQGETLEHTSGKLFLELRNIREKVRYGEYTDSEAASELWRRLASMLESDSSNLSFHLANGELKNVQDFIGSLRDKYDSDGLDFEGMIAEYFKYRDGIPAREKRHKDDRDRYTELAADAKEEYSATAHDALVYGFLYKDLTEKDNAREVLEEMDSDMATALELLKEDFESGETGRIRAASYTLDRVDDFLSTVAVVDLSKGKPKESAGQRVQETSIDNLLGAFSAFEGHETPAPDAVRQITDLDGGLGAKIQERISQVGNDVRFVDREGFDKFFDGKSQDNFRGLPGAFHRGTIFIVYPLENPNEESLGRLYKVLTHEAIHHTMHGAASASTGSSLNMLLYKSPVYSEDGLQLALTGNTIGAQIIRQFMTDRGDQFEDWVQRRTKVGRNRKSNGKLTFEEVIRNEDVAKEILEEAVTVYLTYHVLNGKQVAMKPPYLDFLRRLHETDEGKEMLDSFVPDSNHEESVSLGADDAGESGIPEGLGEGGVSSKKKEEQLPPPELNDLRANIDAILIGTIVQIKKKLKDLYNVEDYEGILAETVDQLNHLRSEVDRFTHEEEEGGEKTSPQTRRSIQKNIDAIKSNLEENLLAKLDDEKKIRDEVPEDELGYVRRLWKETTFVSLDDVLKVFQDGWAYLKERRELRRDRVAAMIGESVSPTERMSSYFEGLKQSVQNRDISKWKEIYTDKDPDSLEKILDKANDINQVKALFEIKAEHHGDFFFRSKQTRDAIGRVCRKRVDTYYQAKAIYDELYGTGEADGLERKNAGTRKGKVSESAEMAKSHADNLEIEWMKMIVAVHEGEWVDSAKFEGFLHYALTAGKSYLRAVLWMIAKGFTLGILDYKTIVEMGGSGLVKNAPHIEYLGDIIKDHDAGIPYKHGVNGMTEIEYIASLDLFDNEGNETRSVNSTQTVPQLDAWTAYEKWLDRSSQSSRVQQRYGKIKSGSDNLDHDYVQDMWWEYNRGYYESILNERTGAVQFIQDQGIANVYGQFITNSLYWTDQDLINRYDKWFKTDRLLVEEDFENKEGKFVIKEGLKQKGNNRTVLDDDKLEVDGAMYKGLAMKYFRNLAYFAWKQSKGDMRIARDIMMAGALDLKIGWVPEASVRRYYELNKGNGWNYANVERWRATVDPRALPDAPQSHLYEFRGTSMDKDLGGYPRNFI